MKKRMFTIISIAVLPIMALVLLYSQGLFLTSPNAIETYSRYEKQLSQLFVEYGKQSDSMTEEQFDAWQSEIEQASNKAAKALIKIQKDPEDWKTYLAATGQPYRPSPLAEWEYTGLAAKKPSEITSDQFDAWWDAQAKQDDERSRAEMRADGIWDDQKIEQIITRVNESLANDPDRQHTKKRMRELVIWNEGRADREKERAKSKREEAAYQAQRAKDKAWLAAEEAELAKMFSDTSETPPEQMAFPDGDSDSFDAQPPVENPPRATDVDSEGIPTAPPPPVPPDKPFNPEDFAFRLSEDMSRWDETLQESYQDVFNLDESFEQRLPKQARSYFQERKQRLQSEYVRRLDTMLRQTPRENRANTLRIVREKLSQNWGSHFADAILRQLDADSN